MAANVFTDGWVERILAKILLKARKKQAIIGRIKTDFSAETKRKSEQILIRTGVRPGTYAITPAPTRPPSAAVTPGTKSITLDQWFGSSVELGRKEVAEMLAGDFLDDALQNAGNEVVNLIVNDVTTKAMQGTASYVGSASQALFQNVAEPHANAYEGINIVPAAVGQLAQQEVDIEQDITFLMGIPEMTAAQQLPAVRDVDRSGSDRTLREGKIGFVGGADLEWQYTLPTHTAGSQTGAPAVTGATAVGATSVSFTTGAGEALTLVVGDIIEFSNDADNTYVVTAGVTLGASASGSASIESHRFGRSGGLETALAGAETITIVATHRANLCFHRDFMGLAVRSAEEMAISDGAFANQTGTIYRTMADDEEGGSGLVLTLAVFGHEYHQMGFEVSALWGASVLHPWLATRAIAAP